MESDFTTLLALFADFEAAKDAYYSQLNAAPLAAPAMPAVGIADRKRLRPYHRAK